MNEVMTKSTYLRVLHKSVHALTILHDSGSLSSLVCLIGTIKVHLWVLNLEQLQSNKHLSNTMRLVLIATGDKQKKQNKT